ncbi:glycoside hydrolase family protein [Salmonella enterica]|uniref:Lysozyme n=4 Tax=Salmonella enterica TaxID=28901 RepID=A0A5Z6MAX2_SALET|nr:lysozyme [Salmonella enterica]EAW2115917.1 lysozyme [Salmonella enterica subsp. enterica]EBV8290366.1 lysozyme [Salmonella enterica subsp. arizonae serovar 18:z4,z23:-]EBV9432828.1 lysozyme [Salmonella enterica subsp. enterica serovar Heidelberg]ECC3303137.1 lysozyme [Salmonella enterica subsp. arizonae]ECU7350976.1 lysozyme [Salmonella enterica subsp. enterica serovar Kentucky]EDB5611757.1 glycoside hydrolase family protein [Salmonella enterica subsp. enterica serovar Infantis]EDN5651335
MNKNSDIFSLLKVEEGVSHKPYIDALGYPTVGVGFKLGPQGANLKNYTFCLTDNVIEAWLQENINRVYKSMQQNEKINQALLCSNSVRTDILISMAYQMGVNGLAGFNSMLMAITEQEWNNAADEMRRSIWAKQTPKRAERHAAVIESGQWAPVYNFAINQ